MTRRITSHKGGRTARATEARIRPATLERIHETMRERKMSWADLIEEQWGQSTSERKTASARENGKKGGRPRKNQGDDTMAKIGDKFNWMGREWTVKWVGYDGWYIAVASDGEEKNFSPETWK